MNVLLLGSKGDWEPSIVATLERAGHIIQVPKRLEEALSLINQRSFDCVVLSYSLSNEVIEQFVELLKQACPTCPLIAISENGAMDLKLQPARMLQWSQGVEALVTTLAMMERRMRRLNKQQNGPGRENLSKAQQRRYSDKRFRAET